MKPFLLTQQQNSEIADVMGKKDSTTNFRDYYKINFKQVKSFKRKEKTRKFNSNSPQRQKENDENMTITDPQFVQKITDKLTQLENEINQENLDNNQSNNRLPQVKKFQYTHTTNDRFSRSPMPTRENQQLNISIQSNNENSKKNQFIQFEQADLLKNGDRKSPNESKQNQKFLDVMKFVIRKTDSTLIGQDELEYDLKDQNTEYIVENEPIVQDQGGRKLQLQFSYPINRVSVFGNEKQQNSIIITRNALMGRSISPQDKRDISQAIQFQCIEILQKLKENQKVYLHPTQNKAILCLKSLEYISNDLTCYDEILERVRKELYYSIICYQRQAYTILQQLNDKQQVAVKQNSTYYEVLDSLIPRIYNLREQFKHELEDKDQEIGNLKSEIKDLRGKVQQTELKFSLFSGQLEEQKNELMKEFEQERLKIIREKEKLNRDIQNKNRDLANIEAMLKKKQMNLLSHIDSEKEQLKMDQYQLMTAMEELKDENRNYKKFNTDLKQQLQKHMIALFQYRENDDYLQKQLYSVQEENDELRTRNMNIENLTPRPNFSAINSILGIQFKVKIKTSENLGLIHEQIIQKFEEQQIKETDIGQKKGFLNKILSKKSELNSITPNSNLQQLGQSVPIPSPLKATIIQEFNYQNTNSIQKATKDQDSPPKRDGNLNKDPNSKRDTAPKQATPVTSEQSFKNLTSKFIPALSSSIPVEETDQENTPQKNLRMPSIQGAIYQQEEGELQSLIPGIVIQTFDKQKK